MESGVRGFNKMALRNSAKRLRHWSTKPLLGENPMKSAELEPTERPLKYLIGR